MARLIMKVITPVRVMRVSINGLFRAIQTVALKHLNGLMNWQKKRA
jgi:hypothetical protein